MDCWQEKYLSDALKMWDMALKRVYGSQSGKMELVGGPLDGRIVPDRPRWIRGVSPHHDDPDKRLIVDEYERLETKPVAVYMGRRRAEQGEV